jgi:hypothetical protein
MPIISTTTIYNRDGTSATLDADQARYRTQMRPDEWSTTPPAPAGWERVIPIYKVVRSLRPASRPRYLHEPPFESMSDNDCWQYGDRFYAAGEEIESMAWPHPSMRAQNYSAERVHSYFLGAMKSRLPLSPFRGDRIVLADGISGALPVDVRAAPRPAPFNSRPAA